MFYDNHIKNKMKFRNYSIPSFDTSISSKDPELLPFGSCMEEYNVDCSSGAISTGMGFSDLTLYYSGWLLDHNKTLNLPRDLVVKDCYFVRPWVAMDKCFYSIIILHMSDGSFRYNKLDQENDCEFNIIGNINFAHNMPNVFMTKINGTDYIMFNSDAEGVYMWHCGQTNARLVESFPKIKSACNYGNRMFLIPSTNRKTIMFSESLNPLNYDGDSDQMGYINISDDYGSCNKLLNFKNSLYCVKEYNLVKIVSSANKQMYTYDSIDLNNSLIFPNTAVVCDEKIVYLSSVGLYSFNGSKVEKIDFDKQDLIYKLDNHFSVATYLNGCYYLATRAKFKDDDKIGIENANDFYNNVIFKIDLKTKQCCCIRGVNIVGLDTIKDKDNSCVMVCYAVRAGMYTVGLLDMSGANKGNQLFNKKWQSHISNLGLGDKYKFIRSISLLAKENVTLILNLDQKEFRYDLKGKNTTQCVKINKKAKEIGFGFETTGAKIYVSKPVFDIGVL